MDQDRLQHFMALAMREAEEAYEMGEVPVGAIVVFDDKVIGRGYNRMSQLRDASAHAEMIALSAAYNRFGDWRLENCTLFCTLEPCAMCAGAAVLSRVKTIVFGARDPKFGACGSIFDIPREPKLNHRIEVIEGVMAEPIAQMMRDFFVSVRKGKEEVN
jgi:tRNA(adenine34) deaminase